MKIRNFETVDETSLSEILDVETKVFKDPYSKEKLREKIDKVKNFYGAISYEGDELSGYRLGYESEEGVFYVWPLGVVPDFRKKGIADSLMKEQEVWCKDKGYKKIKLKSHNGFKTAMIFYLKKEYEITDTYRKEEGDELTIVFEKEL